MNDSIKKHPIWRDMSSSRKKRLQFLCVALCAALWAGANLLSLERYPPVSCDESFYGRSALRFAAALASGEEWPSAGAMFYLPHGRIYWLALSGVFALLGRSLFSARLVSLAAWAGLVGATYLVGIKCASRRVALWSAGLVAVAWLSLHAGHRIRPDMLAAAVGTAAVALTEIVVDQPRTWPYVLLGLAITLQLDVHFILLHLAWPLALLTIGRLLRERAFGKTAAFLLGLLLGGVTVTWLHTGVVLGTVGELFLGNPIGFVMSYVRGPGGNTGLIWTFGNSLYMFLRFWWRFYGGLIPLLSLPQAVLFAVGLVATLFGGNHRLRRLAFVVLLSSVTFAAINSRYQIIGYAMLWFPLYLIMGVAATFRLCERWGKRPLTQRLLPVASLLGLFIVYLGADGYLILSHRAGIYQDDADELAEFVEPGASVLTSSLWWYAFPEDVVLIDEILLNPINSNLWWNAVPDEDDYDLEVMIPSREQTSLVEASRMVETRLAHELRPDYVIDDGTTGCHTTVTPLARAMTAYVGEMCTRIGELDSELYGTQIVYACQWPQPGTDSP